MCGQIIKIINAENQHYFTGSQIYLFILKEFIMDAHWVLPQQIPKCFYTNGNKWNGIWNLRTVWTTVTFLARWNSTKAGYLHVDGTVTDIKHEKCSRLSARRRLTSGLARTHLKAEGFARSQDHRSASSSWMMTWWNEGLFRGCRANCIHITVGNRETSASLRTVCIYFLIVPVF